MSLLGLTGGYHGDTITPHQSCNGNSATEKAFLVRRKAVLLSALSHGFQWKTHRTSCWQIWHPGRHLEKNQSSSVNNWFRFKFYQRGAEHLPITESLKSSAVTRSSCKTLKLSFTSACKPFRLVFNH